MSMDAARARFPECPVCGGDVDENGPDFTATFCQGEWYHPICLRQIGIDVETGQPLETTDPRTDRAESAALSRR